MLPRRSSSSANQRRSSILKPPKTRQPFQDLDFNTSSPDISPESTRKRRVSFAEKKHVKEFCDHKEQGTIWDSTYEEAHENDSKSIEISSENVDVINTDLENVEIEMKEAGYGFLHSNFELGKTVPSVTMDPNTEAKSLLRRKQSENNDFELTDIIPCSQNNLMSQTMYCQDSELDITEAIGGIEPTVSLKNLAHSQARKMTSSNGTERGIKFTENTILFENTESEINFTEVVSTQKPEASAPLMVINSRTVEEDDDSLIQNQTIIFEDSVMELTLTESPLSKPDKNEKLRECEVRNTGNNKTIVFNDLGCEMTEAIDTVIHKMPQIVLDQENLEMHFQTEQGPGVSDLNGDKTIFFDDFRCEMTEAINLMRHCPTDDENVEITNDNAQVVSSKVENIPLGNIMSELITEHNNQAAFRDNSVMEFTIAITREKSSQSETQQSSLGIILNQISESASKLVHKVEESAECLNESAMEFTAALKSQDSVRNEVEDESSRRIKAQTLIYEDSDSDVREDVITAPCISNLVLSSVEQDDPSNTGFESGDLQKKKKKRKSDEITKNIAGQLSPDATLSQNFEPLLVQSLVHNDNSMNQFPSSCKRIKIGEDATQEHTSSHEVDCRTSNPEELRNSSSKETIDVALVTSQEVQQTESTTRAEVLAPNCSKNEENLVVNESRESEKEEMLETNDNDVEGECSFVEAMLSNLDNSESDILEFSRVYEKQRQSIIKEDEDIESRLEPDKRGLDHDDDCYFVMFSEELEKRAKSDDCIWKIRSINTKKILIDFICKSFVVIIHLEETEDPTTSKIIREIRMISLLPDSADENISMVHNILLRKLDPESLRRKHRTTQDILCLLEFISIKLKLAMDFMYEFEKLQDLHLMIRRGNQISFRLHSYKVTLVIKITIDIEPLEDIGPNNVKVECILGNIREKDIKELIIGVKKDHKFLTNYIKDIKEYIALLVEK